MPARITLTCRLAVTGHTFFSSQEDADQRAAEESQRRASVMRRMELVLDAVKAGLDDAQQASNSPCLKTVADHTRLVQLSSLAPGTDQLSAEAALRHGYEIAAILPGCRSEYAAALKEKSAQAKLLELAERATKVIELDNPLPGGEENELVRKQAYRIANHIVLQNADFLVAVWDDERPKNRGGTAEMVDRAKRVGMPVFVIDPTTELIFVIDSSGAFIRGDDVAIRQTIRQLVADELCLVDTRIPAVSRWDGHDSPQARSARERHLENDGLKRYFQERPISSTIPSGKRNEPLVSGRGWFWLGLAGLWAAFDGFWSVPKRPWKQTGERTLLTPILAHLQQRQAFIDELAVYYSRLHRLSLAALYLLGVFAVFFAACAGITSVYESVLHAEHEPQPPVSSIEATHEAPAPSDSWSTAQLCFLELACLLLMGVIYLTSYHEEWHQRSTDYRLLAERLRHAAALSLLGRASWIYAYEPLPAQYSTGSERLGWVDRVFRAMLRDDFLPIGTQDFAADDGRYVRECRDYLTHDYLWEQIDYHRRNAIKVHHQHLFIERFAGIAFLVTIGCCLSHFVMHHDALSIFGITLPAIVAACHGITAQFHLRRVLARSEAMEHHLHAHFAEIEKLPSGTPSDRIARRMQEVSELMLRESDEWRVVFRLLNVPTPG